MEQRKITFIGAGNMARSIISGLVKFGYPANKIMACNRSPEKLEELKNRLNINTSLNNNEGINFAQTIVLAVKPQMMDAMCAALDRSQNFADKLFVSIAAGLTTERLQQMLGQPVSIIRAMPNTPSLLGKGMTGLYAAPSLANEDKVFVENIMCAVGKTIWVNKESQINGVIAAAGSSPAYFFLFLEAMQQETIAMGFDPQTAREMVQQAMLGAAEMVCHNSELEISELRAQVTSKGGTTAKAVDTFVSEDLASIVSRAMQAAVVRALEMEKNF